MDKFSCKRMVTLVGYQNQLWWIQSDPDYPNCPILFLTSLFFKSKLKVEKRHRHFVSLLLYLEILVDRKPLHAIILSRQIQTHQKLFHTFLRLKAIVRHLTNSKPLLGIPDFTTP